MNKLKIAVTGCLGRMGKQIIKSAKNDKSFRLIAITESKVINKKISGLKPTLNSISSFKNTNIIIDFTVPKCTLEILKIATKLKRE